MAALPAYSFVLGLIALLGYMAIAAGVKPLTSNGKPDANTVVPLLFDQMFPDWFAGVAFAAIGDRRARARGDHVDRGGEPVHAQHLQGVPQAATRRPRRRRGSASSRRWSSRSARWS